MKSRLFSSCKIGPLKLSNRIVVSSMCQYSASDGSATEWHNIHVGMLSQSGAGLLMLEATAVEPSGRITYGDLGLYSTANERALGNVLDGVRQFSQIPIGLQLCHAGREASSEVPWLGGKLIDKRRQNGWERIAPSAVAVTEAEPPPLALDRRGMTRIRGRFVGSVERAKRIGVSLIQLHFAHGYLLHQFLSPITNQRSDQYGGRIENRIRYPVEVFDAVRDAWPDKPLGIRISATDWIDGGWDIEQSLELVDVLRSHGCDWVDVSSGGLAPQQKIPVGIGYQLPFARRIRNETHMITSTVGLITEPKQAEQIITTGDADLVSLARAMLWDPRWPWHAAVELGGTVRAPKQYWRCMPRGVSDVFSGWRSGSR